LFETAPLDLLGAEDGRRPSLELFAFGDCCRPVVPIATVPDPPAARFRAGAR
jgi:hypothetical protein